MSIFCLGVNHKTAPVEIRERLAFVEKDIPANLREICELDSVDEAVVLSTCNRVEIYGASDDTAAATGHIVKYLAGHFDIQEDQVEFYSHHDEAAARHLFEVASGLDSMVLGETEIFGQVKKAYAKAQSTGVTRRRLNKLFQQSFTIGKLVRSNTRIQQGSTSVGSAAVDLAETIFGDLKGCSVLIVGAGEMSRTTAQSLQSRGASRIVVTNRSHEKALELAGELQGTAVEFENWESELAKVDIVISSTSAPTPIVKADMVEKAMPKRRGHSLLLIDIAVPRDIEDEVNEIDNAYLYNIDNLQQLAEEGRVRRQKQIEICQEVIRKFLGEKGIEALAEVPPRQASEESGNASASSNGRPLTNP
mgnify:CR=1 FL=1